MPNERAYELLAMRREAIIERGGAPAKRASATKKAAAKRAPGAKKASKSSAKSPKPRRPAAKKP